MKENGKWMTNDYNIKITNPIYSPLRDSDNDYIDSSHNFVGSADAFDYKFQTKNYNKLKESLEPLNIYLKKIYAGNIHSPSYTFVVETNSNIVWFKRATRGMSANNFLFVGKLKMKLHEWFALTYNERLELINQ